MENWHNGETFSEIYDIEFPSPVPLLSFGQNEETLDVADANKFIDQSAVVEVPDQSLDNLVIFPMDQIGAPGRGNFPGHLQFEVAVNGNDTSRPKYIYSYKLNRIYVQMATEFSLQFKWDFARVPDPGARYYVRATLAFTDERMWEKKVQRCAGHSHAKDETNNGLKSHIINHVLRSARTPNSEGLWYCGSAENPQSWLSVIVSFPAVPETGSISFAHAYSFVCKNTCPGGINRRDIEIIFTLEDHFGVVLGRQSVGACISSCPKRDVKNHEKQLVTRKRQMADDADVAPPTNKKVKKEITEPPPVFSVDTTMYSFNLQIMGRQNAKMMLKGCLNAAMADASRLSSLGEPVPQECTKSIDTLQRMLDDLHSDRNK